MFSSNSSQVSTAANYIEDVFSTYLYTGTGAAQSIPNSIQLANGATTAGWIAEFGHSQTETAYSIAVAASGNVYVCGSSNASGNFDQQIIKYDSLGSILWQRTLGGTASDYAYSVAVDNSENVYVCGEANIASSQDFVVAKYNASGSIQWQRKLTSGNEVAQSLKVSGAGNVYVCGYSIVAANYKFQIAKYDTSGVIQWKRELGNSGGSVSVGYGIAIDSSENVYITGESNVSSNAAIITAKYNASGVIQWQRQLNADGVQIGYSIAVDSSGNAYVCGKSDTNIQIAKYNTSGTIQWQRSLEQTAGNCQANSIAVDISDNIYICGQVNTASTDIVIAKYNSSGTIQWQRKLSANITSGTDVGRSIAVDATGSIYVCGSTDISGSTNFLVAKLPNDGTGTGFYAVGSSKYTYAVSSLVDAATSLSSATPTLTEAASTLADSASSLTDSMSNLTSYSTVIPSGTGYGGLVWMKGRSGATDHALYDTARGATFDLASNTTAAQTTQATGLTSFDGNGFSIGALAKINTNAATYASWTFRKQAKFFDVVTYTGNGVDGRTIAHNLGSAPGTIIIKRTSSDASWPVWHRSLSDASVSYANNLFLNLTDAASNQFCFKPAASQTSSVFAVGNDSLVNGNGQTYVAYLFAHNAGGFGATGADNVISCGSFTTDGSGNATVSLGYEPQFLITKRVDASASWYMHDIMRGIASTGAGDTRILYPDLPNAEDGGTNALVNATGFTISNYASANQIYIAIRRGPMRTPTTGTSVFGLSARTGTGANATVTGGQTDDAILVKNRGSAVASLFSSRLTGRGYLVTSSTAAEVAAGTTILQDNPWDVMDGVKLGTTSSITNAFSSTFINYLFRRAPGFFDVVCYTGTGSATTVAHNLGAVPEFMLNKGRAGTGSTAAFQVYYGDPTKRLVLNTTAASVTDSTVWNDTAPTATVFSLGTDTVVNGSSGTKIAYLFATVAGVSKIGSYTGSGTTKQIDCGFTAGARFVLIKRTDSTGDWYVWDTARGIVAGNDPYWLLNSAAAQVTGTDYVDTYSAGFEISSTAPAAINANGGSFIFLAIA